MKKKKTKQPVVKWPLILKTKRLVLRPYRPSDYVEWVKAFSSRKPAQNEFDDGPKPLSELTRARLNRICRVHADIASKDFCYVWCIFEKKSGAILGWVDLYIFDRGHVQSANFGYGLHNQHWGHNYGIEAAKALALAAFRHLKLHRLEATIGTTNRASIKLIRALGFRKEGLRKKSDWRKGKWHDEWVYSAIPEDFGLPMSPPKIQRI